MFKNGHWADRTSQVIEFQRNMVFTKKNIYNYWLKRILGKLSKGENKLSVHLITWMAQITEWLPAILDYMRNVRWTYQRVWPSFLFSASFCRVNKMIQWMSSDVTTSALYKLPRAIDNRPLWIFEYLGWLEYVNMKHEALPLPPVFDWVGIGWDVDMFTSHSSCNPE